MATRAGVATAAHGWARGGGRRLAPALAWLLLLAMPGPVPAAAAEGAVVLTVSDGHGASRDFTLKALEGLGTVELATITPFTTRVSRFAGVPLERLADAVRTSGETFHVTALDGYAVDIPRSDVTRFEPILASSMDGEPLPEGDQGPLWVIYPWSDHPAELAGPLFEARAIWQVRSLEVR